MFILRRFLAFIPVALIVALIVFLMPICRRATR